jgi:hypothetical protein
MNGALLIRWGENIPGRESKALEVFGKAVARFEEYAKVGRVHGHREYFPLTGRQGGFMIADGEAEELLKILGDEDTIQFNSEAASVVSDYSIDVYAGGDDQTVQRLTGNYTQRMQELGYM